MFANCYAKDMTARLGVGIANASGFDVPSMAVQYYPNPHFGLIGNFGLDTEQNASRMFLMGAIRRLIFQETNMNFFMQGGLAYQSYQLAAPGTGALSTNTGFELTALLADEFFLPGLENLGLNFAGGAAVSSAGSVRFRTVADHFLRAGIIFYF